MKLPKTYFTISSSIIIALLSSCSQNSSVTKAPHRTTAVNKQAGIIQHSNPITVSKNSGIGSTIGSIGGSLGGSKIGSGTGRIVGSIAASVFGSRAGSTAETQIRQKSAQEILVQINGKSHKFINNSSNSYQSGDTVWATTNVYGEPLSLTPR